MWELTSVCGEKICRSRISLSDIIAIFIAFNISKYRTFKDFYTKLVLPSWGSAFPSLVSSTKFV